MFSIAGTFRQNKTGIFQILTIMAITIAAILIFYHAMFRYGFQGPTVLAATICFCVLWCCAVAPAVCTLGKTWIKKLFRAGTVSDSTGIALLIIWIIFPEGQLYTEFDIWAVLKVYCLCTAITMMSSSFACIARTVCGVVIAAAVSWVLFLSAIASPFWISKSLENSAQNESLVNLAATVNPVWGALDAVVPQTAMPWHRGGGMLYNFTTVGEYATPTKFGWWQTSLLFGIVATICWTIAYLRRKFSRNKTVILKADFSEE